MRKPVSFLFGALVLLFLAGCVVAIRKAAPPAVRPLPGNQLGAADEFALPPLAK